MTTGLKTTLLASSGFAVALNLIQLSVGATTQAKDAFAASSISAIPTPNVAAKKVVTVSPAANPPALSADIAPTPPPAPAPRPDPTVASASARLNAAGLSATFAADYLAVQARTGTPWQLLAAVHRVETTQSGDTNRQSSAGATGPMQFMPATFAHYKLDGDGNGTAVITDVDDALMTAGNYLRAGGAAQGNYNQALFNYNHSNTYVANVLAIAHRLGL